MMMSSTSAPSTTLEQIFAYGQTRERYGMKEGEPRRPLQHIQHFVRHEHANTLKHALLHDKDHFRNDHIAALEKADLHWQLAISPISRQCVWELHSGILIRLLENITGLTQLVPDAQCRYLQLLDTTNQSLVPVNWHDEATNLPIVLYVFIGLDSGAAMLCPDKNQEIILAEPTLQVAYFHYSGETP